MCWQIVYICVIFYKGDFMPRRAREISTITMDTAAMIKDGRTFLPFRFIAEAFGAEVEYGPEDGPVERVTFLQ